MPPLQATPPNNVVAWIAIGISCVSIIVSITGWFVIHWLAIKRDKELEAKARASDIANRKHDFRAFMEAWKVAIDRGYASNRFQVYADRVADFKRQATLLSRDFTDTEKARFSELVCNASSFKSAQKENEKTPDKALILDVFDEVIKFLGAS